MPIIETKTIAFTQTDLDAVKLAPKVSTASAVQYPPPPCNDFPPLSFDLGWAHAKFTDRITLNDFVGSMAWEKRDGGKRRYRFEAYYENSAWKAVISACDPENPNPFEDRNMGSGPSRPIKGLRKSDRRDIAKKAEHLATRCRKQVEEQRKWLLDRFYYTLHRLRPRRRMAHSPRPHALWRVRCLR